LKSFKTFVPKICKEEFGHLVMLALLDIIDDTVLLTKALFPEIVSNMEDIIADQYGRKVCLYILKPRSPSYFLPAIVKILEQGDNNEYSKKSAEVRQKEIRAAILPDILKSMTSHVTDIMKNKSAAIVLLAALECADDSDELKNIFEKIVDIVSEPLEKKESGDGIEASDTNGEHPVCHPCGHWVIKTLVQQDKKRAEAGKTTMFATLLIDALPASQLARWSSFNRGAFVLVSLIECGVEGVREKVVEHLDLPDTINDDALPGLKLLHKILHTE